MPAAVVACGHRHWLAVAGLQKLKLALVHDFAYGVVDKALRIGLLHRRHNLGKGQRHRGGDLGVQIERPAVGQMHLAVDDIGVRAGGRAVKGPLKLPKGQRQPAQRHATIRPRIAQPPGLCRQVSRHRGQQLRRAKNKALGQLQLERAPASIHANQPCSRASQPEQKDRRGTAMKVAALRGGDQNQARLRGSRFKSGDKCGVQRCGHKMRILSRRSLPPHSRSFRSECSWL